jgi:hypothetical protein
MRAGWAPYSYSRSLTSPSGTPWVAVGIRVAWETHRDYWIDHVTVTGPAVPEPAGGVLAGAGGFVAVHIASRGRRAKSRRRQTHVAAARFD